jgi:hypothetical protein
LSDFDPTREIAFARGGLSLLQLDRAFKELSHAGLHAGTTSIIHSAGPMTAIGEGPYAASITTQLIKY